MGTGSLPPPARETDADPGVFAGGLFCVIGPAAPRGYPRCSPLTNPDAPRNRSHDGGSLGIGVGGPTLTDPDTSLCVAGHVGTVGAEVRRPTLTNPDTSLRGPGRGGTLDAEARRPTLTDPDTSLRVPGHGGTLDAEARRPTLTDPDTLLHTPSRAVGPGTLARRRMLTNPDTCRRIAAMFMAAGLLFACAPIDAPPPPPAPPASVAAVGDARFYGRWRGSWRPAAYYRSAWDMHPAVLIDVRPGAGSGEVEVVYTVSSLGRTHTVPGRGRIVGDRLSAEIAYGQGIGLTLTGPGRADGEYRGYAPAGVADGQFVRE